MSSRVMPLESKYVVASRGRGLGLFDTRPRLPSVIHLQNAGPAFVGVATIAPVWGGVGGRGEVDLRRSSGRASAPMRSRIGRVTRALRVLATDPRIPAPVRWLLLVGLLPIPGPVDEVALALAAILLLFYRHRVRMILADAGSRVPPGPGETEPAP
jgi:hypothetical protein